MRQFSIFLKGTAILTFAGLVNRFLGFFYKIFLAQKIGAEGMGIYQLIFPVFSICHALTSSGIEIAISRFTAFHPKKEHASFLYAGLLFSLSVSALLSLIIWQQAPYIAAQLLHETRCEPLLRIIALVIPLSTIHCCFTGSYLGKKKASIPAISQLLEQLLRIGTVWVLYQISMQQGKEITPRLAALGLLAGEAGSALFMLTVANERFPGIRQLRLLFSRCRTLLQMSLPLTGTRLGLSILQSAEAILIPLSLQKSGLNTAEALSMYGILTSMSLSFLLFPNSIAASVSAMLLPVISEEQSHGNKKNISTAIEYTILFGLVIGILFMGIFLKYGLSLGTLFFHEQLAGEFLVTLAWICPILYFTGNLNSILHGLGNTKVTFVNQIITLVIRLLFTIFLVPKFGIQGVLWGILTSQLLLCILGIRAISPHLQLTLGLDTFVLKPLASIILATGGIELLKHILPIILSGGKILELIISICLMAIIYFLLLFAFGFYQLLRLHF